MNTSNRFGFTPLNKEKETTSFPGEIDSKENRFGFTPINNQEPQKEESFIESGVRKLSGNLARGLESILGSVGEFQELAENITKPLAEMIFPVKEEKKSMIKTALPTSSKLREKTKKLTGEYLEPKGKTETTAQEASSLLGSLLGPMSFRKALGVALGSQAVKEGLGLYGAKPSTQEASKFATTLGLSMINPNGIKKYWTSLYDKRDALTPVNTFVNDKNLESTALKVATDIRKGLIAPSEAKVLEQAEKIIGKVKNGVVDLNEMIAVKRSLNEIAGDPELFKRGQHLFPKLQKAVNETLSLHPNKEAVKLGKMADEAFGAFLESQKLSRNIKKMIGDKPLRNVLLGTVIEGLSGHPEAIIPTISTAGAVAGGVKTYELFSRIMSNPTTRKYYLDLLIQSGKGNINSGQKILRKLDEELEKEELKLGSRSPRR